MTASYTRPAGIAAVLAAVAGASSQAPPEPLDVSGDRSGVQVRAGAGEALSVAQDGDKAERVTVEDRPALDPTQAARTHMAFAKYGLHEESYVPGRWEPCSCADFDDYTRPGLSVYSTFTDPERELFTVWGEPDGRHPAAASIVVMPRGTGCYHLRYVEAIDEATGGRT